MTRSQAQQCRRHTGRRSRLHEGIAVVGRDRLGRGVWRDARGRLTFHHVGDHRGEGNPFGVLPRRIVTGRADGKGLGQHPSLDLP